MAAGQATGEALTNAPPNGHTRESSLKGDGKASDGKDFLSQSRSNDIHVSKTGPDSRLSRKGKTASVLRFIGHILMENRNGLIVNATVTQAGGHAERMAAKAKSMTPGM